MVLDLADEPVDVDDGVVAVVGLGAWCDFVTPDEYRQRLVGADGARLSNGSRVQTRVLSTLLLRPRRGAQAGRALQSDSLTTR